MVAKRRKSTLAQVPKVGDEIYVPSCSEILAADEGDEVHIGGLAKVGKIGDIRSLGGTLIPGGPWVWVEEHPGWPYRLEWLAKLQAKLRKEFGKRRARAGVVEKIEVILK